MARHRTACGNFAITFTFSLMVFVYVSFMTFAVKPLAITPSAHSTTHAIIISAAFFMMLVSFVAVATTEAGDVPDWFGDGNSPKSGLVVIERKADGSIRYCNKCRGFKPDRTHHCRVCKRCYVKMDHHCPWVNNCVGYRNYKLFLLFITYSLFCVIFVFVSTLTLIPSFFASAPTTDVIIVLIDCIVTGILGLILTGFVSFHYFLVTHNYTTIEFLEKRGCSPEEKHANFYDLGVWENLKRALGYNPLFWPFPIMVCMIDENSGVSFPTNDAFNKSESKL
eukprot:c39596_g1_i1.p1 GENE.c39596_g1_i1~~c39596_g1_i1.p1  ORF type:complete len:280 (+),score=61.26 c39596_g1_i1:54-893(+)